MLESLLSTMLHDKKSNDEVKSRNDLEDWGIRHGHAQPRRNKTYLPSSPYTLSNSKKKNCKRLYDFKGHDGYNSHFKNCVSLEVCKVSGLNSYDYHVLMQ